MLTSPNLSKIYNSITAIEYSEFMPRTNPSQSQLTILLDAALYQKVKDKCKNQYGIGVTPLIKMFLKSFVTQAGVGFFIGDVDLQNIFFRWLSKKILQKNRKGSAPLPGPRLKDLYEI
jgi:hypothetical protein